MEAARLAYLIIFKSVHPSNGVKINICYPCKKKREKVCRFKIMPYLCTVLSK